MYIYINKNNILKLFNKNPILKIIIKIQKN